MSLIKVIDAHLQATPRDERAVRCFHPSSLHKPARTLYDEYFNGPSEIFPAKVLRIFDNGHHVHDRLQAYLEQAGVLLRREVPVLNREYEIQGTCDGIIQLGGRRGVLEIKSCNERAFERIMVEPDKHHMGQLNVYMFCMGLTRGALLYENKNTQELMEYFVRFDQSVLEPILDKIRHVQACIKAGTPPEPGPNSAQARMDHAASILSRF